MKITFAHLLLVASILTVPAARAEIELDLSGYAISTVAAPGGMDDGVYVSSAMLPDDDVLFLPYYFVGEPDETSLSVQFNGADVEVIGGARLLAGSLDYLALDISAIRSQTGEFRLTVSSSGTTPAKFLLVDEIEPKDESGGDTTGGTTTGGETTGTGGTTGSGAGVGSDENESSGGAFPLQGSVALLLISLLAPGTRTRRR